MMYHRLEHSWMTRPLSPALRKKAEDELKETPARARADMRLIRNWLKKQPHLQSINPTDQWLVAFLRGCKYDIDKCKGKVDMYYTLKGAVPEFYEIRDPFDENIQKMLKLGVFLPLKKNIHEDSPRICISRVGPYSDSQLPLSDFIKVSLMIIEIMMIEDDNFTISGEDVVVDMNDLRFGLIWQWTPALARKVTSCAEKALSVRLKSLHLLNPPLGIGAALSIFKMFLGNKMKSRIMSHHNKDTLHDHIDRSVLPHEYGGTDGSIQELIDHWKAKVEHYRDWFLNDSCSDESRRPKITHSGGFFGW